MHAAHRPADDSSPPPGPGGQGGGCSRSLQPAGRSRPLPPAWGLLGAGPPTPPAFGRGGSGAAAGGRPGKPACASASTDSRQAPPWQPASEHKRAHTRSPARSRLRPWPRAVHMPPPARPSPPPAQSFASGRAGAPGAAGQGPGGPEGSRGWSAARRRRQQRPSGRWGSWGAAKSASLAGTATKSAGDVGAGGRRSPPKAIFSPGSGCPDPPQTSHTATRGPGLPPEFFADFSPRPKGAYSSVESCVGGKRTSLFSVHPVFSLAVPPRLPQAHGKAGSSCFPWISPHPDSGFPGQLGATGLGGAGGGPRFRWLE